MNTSAQAAAPEDSDMAMSHAENAVTAEALLQGLTAIAGLDPPLGLRHLRGRSDSYIRLLRNFAETRAADVETMRAQVAAADYAELSSLAHSIKGVAGFLGAVGIEALASDVSVAVRAGRDGAEIVRLAGALMKAQSELRAGVLALLGALPKADS